MRRRWILAMVGLVWVAASVNAKAVRYGSPPEPRQVRAERMVTDFLTHKGWVVAGRKSVTSDGGYSALIFSRTECPGKMAVAVLGGDESAQAAVSALGPDISFLAEGRFAQAPQFGAFQWNATLASALSLFGGPPDAVVPVMGVWPRPGEGGGICSSPRPAEWAALTRLP